MEKSPRRQGHGLLAFCALILSGILLLSLRTSLQRQATPMDWTDIGVQHAGAMSLRIRQSAGRDPALMELLSEDAAEAFVHLPSSWTLREVRGAARETLATAAADGDYTRWAIPAGVTLSFFAPGDPHLRIHNGSATSLLILATRVDLQKNTSDERSVIVNEKAAELW